MPSKSTIAALSAFHGALQLFRKFPIRRGIMKERMPLAQRNDPDSRRRPVTSRPVDTGLNGRLQPRPLRLSNKLLILL
jgi:hypothetical protein